MMDDVDTREAYGRATLDPAGEVIAASYGSWRLTYVVGSKGIAPRGSIRIYTDSDTDWGIPQFDDPTEAEHMTLKAPKGVRMALLVESVTSLLLLVKGQGLRPGEEVVLTYGDRGGGGPGSRAQTFLEERRYFWVAVDAEGDGRFVTLLDSPYVTIAGGTAARLVAVAPSLVILGRPFRLLVRAEDQWGNPAEAYRAKVEIRTPGMSLPEASHNFSAEDRGVHSFDGCRLSRLGICRITSSETGGALTAESNPILCVERAEKHNLYWGEPHGGQVRMATKIEDFFRYARDVGGIDFVGYQANDNRLSREEWALQQQFEREFYEPGRFVPLPGFEWSGRPKEGGHHNVYFRRHDQPIRRSVHGRGLDRSDVDTDLSHIPDVYQAYRNGDVIITPHVGGGRADLSYHEPNLEPVIEVTSTHGTFEWFLEDALERKHRVGFIGGSDGYTGRPGAEYPGLQERRFAKGGLTALYARQLTLEALFEALGARRCYATTGARILIRVEADGHLMGERYTSDSCPEISAFVAGTAPLETVELFRGLERIHTHPLHVAADLDQVRILWEGASRKTSYSGVVWDGSLKVSGATIASVQKVRFDTPRSRILDVSPSGLRWHSVTCGYRSGVILELERDGDCRLELVVNTALMTRALFGGFGDLPPGAMSYRPAEKLAFSFSLAELTSDPIELDLGPLNRKITISLAPEPGGTKTAEFTFTDPCPKPGINPYWLRVLQADMEMAWTSPVFVDYLGPEGSGGTRDCTISSEE